MKDCNDVYSHARGHSPKVEECMTKRTFHHQTRTILHVMCICNELAHSLGIFIKSVLTKTKFTYHFETSKM